MILLPCKIISRGSGIILQGSNVIPQGSSTE
jgi:hypothetical protein